MEDYLIHYGVKGMKWGRRKARPQSLITARANYKSAKKQYNKDFNKANNRRIGAYSPIKRHRQNAEKRWRKAIDSADNVNNAKSKYKSEKNKYKNSDEYKERRKQKVKTAAKVGAAVAGTTLAVYGGYKASQLVKDKSLQIKVKKGEEFYDHVNVKTFKPETFKPDTFKPETFKPDTFKPDTFKPDTFKPDTFKPDTFKPETHRKK